LHSEIHIQAIKMKNLFFSFALLISVLTVSCKKETEVKPQGISATPSTINVEYRVQNQSGNVAVDYIMPNENTGELELKHAVLNRTEVSYNFNYQSGNTFSISASNVSPSHDVVQVQIYVNGVLRVENSTTNPAQSAIAQGNF
jgi:hypothetical protein